MQTVQRTSFPELDQQEDFSLAVFGASDGLWDWDIRRNTAAFSARWKEMLGYEEDEIGNALEEWQGRIHPDDQERSRSTLETYLSGESSVYELEYRLRHKDGGYRWIQARGKALWDENGQPFRMAGSHTDVTQRREAEERLRESEAQYRALVNTSPDSILLTDLDGTIIMANGRAAELYAYPSTDEMIGIKLSELMAPEYRARAMKNCSSMVNKKCVRDQEYVLQRRDGSTFPAEVSTALIKEANGKPRGVIAVARDVSERKRAEKKLRERDELLEKRVTEKTRELHTLLEVSRQVGSTLQIEPLLRLILEMLEDIVDHKGGSLLKLKGDELVIVEYRGPSPREQVVGLRFPLKAIGPIWEPAEQGRPVMICDVRGDDLLAQTFREATKAALGPIETSIWSYIRSWMGVPLVHKGKTIGLLSLATDEPSFYTEEQAKLALALASQAAVAMENAKLYSQAQEAAALEERARLARELHDSVTQALFSITMHADAAQMALDRVGGPPGTNWDSPLARNLRQLSELTDGALAEMRALIFELRPGALQEEGLGEALSKHAAALSAREGLPIEIQIPDHRIPLEASTEEHLYRLAQEALHNVIKHGGASRAQVRVREEQARLILEIEDDGKGFDAASVPAGHLGLRTMADRVEQIDGELEIRSVPGRGTLICVASPCASC